MKKLFVHFVCALPAIQAFGWSLLSGIVGTLILAGFFSTIMSLELLSHLLPWVAGMNAAISGYMLIERNKNDVLHPKMLSAAVGMAVAVASVVAINWFCFQTGNFFLMSDLQGVAAALIGCLGGWSGGILAAKYLKIKQEAAEQAVRVDGETPMEQKDLSKIS